MAENKSNKHVLEAARAAVLATHAAAGLATGAASREVVRLLRSAEALSRSAVALLSTPSTTRSSSGPPRAADAGGATGGAGGGVPTGPPQRPRRRARRSKQKGKGEALDKKDIVMEDVYGSATGGAPFGSTSSASRSLARHETVPWTPFSSPPSAPPPGDLGALLGLGITPPGPTVVQPSDGSGSLPAEGDLESTDNFDNFSD